MENSRRDCIQVLQLFQRKTAETATLEGRLQQRLVNRVCVIRPNNVFYTLIENASKKLFCCIASRDNPTQAGKPIYCFKKSIIDITNLSQEIKMRIGVLCSDGVLHILVLQSVSPQRWERLTSITTEMDLTRCRDIAYSRNFSTIFWPVRTGEQYMVYMYDIQSRLKRELFRGVEPCILQVKNHALVLLFINHGLLLIQFNELFQNFTNLAKRNETVTSDNLRQQLDSLSLPKNATSLSNSENNSRSEIHGTYWNPESSIVEKVTTEGFLPKFCRAKLRGHCLSHDRNIIYVLYGRTVYSLNGQTCVPLMTLEIPQDMHSFHLMFLGRITVLQGEHLTAAYLGSSKPAKVMKKRFKSAGFGFVWDDTGVYQIRMCNPIEMSEELQTAVMSYSPVYTTANAIGQALKGEEVKQDVVDCRQLACPGIVCVAGAYMTRGEQQDELLQSATTRWSNPESWKAHGGRLEAFRRLQNARWKVAQSSPNTTLSPVKPRAPKALA